MGVAMHMDSHQMIVLLMTENLSNTRGSTEQVAQTHMMYTKILEGSKCTHF